MAGKREFPGWYEMSVARRPDGSWRARYRLNGVQYAKHFSRKIDAMNWEAERRAEVAQGQAVDPRRSRQSFKEYAETWRLTQSHRIGTRNLYERTLRLHVYPSIGGRPLSGIVRSDIQTLVSDRASVLGPKTVQNVHRLVAAIFNHALDDGVIIKSPCTRVSLPEILDDPMVLMTTDDVWALAEAVPLRFRALVLLAAGTGLRQGEVLGLTGDRLDFLRREVAVEKQLIAVPGTPLHLGEPKTRKSVRRVPLPDFLVEELSEHLRRQPISHPWGLVFTDSRGGPIGRPSFHKTWRASVTAAELPKTVTFHSLRHAYASLLIHEGLNVVVVSKRLGHSTPSETLKTYAHLFPSDEEDTRRAVERAFLKSGEDRMGTDRADHAL